MSALQPAFAKIEKIDHEQRIVYGVASTETPDGEGGVWNGQRFDGDIIDSEALAKVLGDYLRWGNIREMHGPSAVGKIIDAQIIDKQLHIAVKVEDDTAWHKVVTGIYKGFSIGAYAVAAKLVKIGQKVYRRITQFKRLTEISLVDRPANPDALITLWKAEKMPGTPEKAVAALQGLRNDAEIAGDLESAQLITQAIALVMQASGGSKETAPSGEGEAEGSEAGEMPEGELPIEQGAGLRIVKAGRAFSGSNSESMHNVIKTLAGMLANSGDGIAQKVAACYESGGAKAEGEPMSAEKIAKVVGGELAAQLLNPVVAQLETLTKSMGLVNDRLKTVEAQPAPGGPVARNIPAKQLGQAAATVASDSLAELRKLANTTSNPIQKAEYQRQLAVAEANLRNNR